MMLENICKVSAFLYMVSILYAAPPIDVRWEAFSPIVKIELRDCTSATGFFVGDEYIITAGHIFYKLVYPNELNKNMPEIKPGPLQNYKTDDIGTVKVLDETFDEVLDIQSVGLYLPSTEFRVAYLDFAIIKVEKIKKRHVLILTASAVYNEKYTHFYGALDGDICSEDKSPPPNSLINRRCLRKISNQDLMYPLEMDAKGFFYYKKIATTNSDPAQLYEEDTGGPLVLTPIDQGEPIHVVGYFLGPTTYETAYVFRNVSDFIKEIEDFSRGSVNFEPRNEIDTEVLRNLHKGLPQPIPLRGAPVISHTYEEYQTPEKQELKKTLWITITKTESSASTKRHASCGNDLQPQFPR